MLKAVAELDAKEEAERIARQRAEANLSLAREAAKARALENVDNDAAVISARERLGEVSS
jgi:phage terminase Nu1 subunit (DNA packaging protein)